MFAVADYDGEMGRGRVYRHREDMTLAGLAPGSQDIYIRVIVACQHGGRTPWTTATARLRFDQTILRDGRRGAHPTMLPQRVPGVASVSTLYKM